MRSQLGVQLGRSVDLWLNPSASNRSETASSVSTYNPAPPIGPIVDSQAVTEIAHKRPDIAGALQRLAGIDPELRQAHYEAIRREVLHLGQDEPLSVEMSAEPDSGSRLGQLLSGQVKNDEQEAPPKFAPLSAQAIILQAYQQASRLETPLSLLSFPSA
ncbi:MAG: hypothetical protein H7338_09200 [Candidatus Sericytochromatia bacterium]|nr:hypothetical protein [Candidatus Sericytochromatia bacterium]